MARPNEINWWIDHTGSTHTHCAPTDPRIALAVGKVYLDSKAGVITHLNNKPANLSLISHELLDVLHAQFPGTRWWIKDINAADAPKPSVAKHQAAS